MGAVNGLPIVGDEIPILDTRSADTKRLDHAQELAGALVTAFRTGNNDLIDATLELALTHRGTAGAVAGLLHGFTVMLDQIQPKILDGFLVKYAVPKDCGDWCLDPPEAK